MTPCFSSSPCPPVIFLFSHFTFLSVVDLVQCRTIFLFLYSSFFLLSVRFSVFFFLLQNIINYISPSDLFSVTFRIKCFIFSVFVLIFHSFLCSLRSFIFFFCVFLLFLLIIPKTFFPYFLFRCFFYTSFFKPFLLVFPLSTSFFLFLFPPPSLPFFLPSFDFIPSSITYFSYSFLPSFIAFFLHNFSPSFVPSFLPCDKFTLFPSLCLSSCVTCSDVSWGFFFFTPMSHESTPGVSLTLFNCLSLMPLFLSPCLSFLTYFLLRFFPHFPENTI